MKFGHVWQTFLACFWLSAGDWKLVPGPFMILLLNNNIANYIYQFAKYGDLLSCGSKDIFQNALCLMY